MPRFLRTSGWLVALLASLGGCWDWSRPVYLGNKPPTDAHDDAGIDGASRDGAADGAKDGAADGARDGAGDATGDWGPDAPLDFAVDSVPSDVTADVLPGDVLPGDVLPGDVLPGDVLPGDVLPGDVLPGDTTPPCKWAVRHKLTFDNSAQPSALKDFPVLVVLTPARIAYAQTRGSGQDIRFTESDGITTLPHEIERWVKNGTSLIWVKVPQIAAASKTGHIWLYHDASLPDGQQPAAVWTANYRAVWHLENAKDSTSNANDGTISGSTPAPGKIDGAQHFDGSKSYIEAPASSSLENIFDGGGTISAWIYPTGWGEAKYGRIVDKSSALNARNGYGFELDGRPGKKMLLLDSGFTLFRGLWETPPGSIKLNAWQYVVVTYDSSSTATVPTFYVDGVAQTLVKKQAPTGSSPNDTGRPLRIGNFSAKTSRTFDGVIDEVRMSRTARSAAWVAAQHLTQRDTFITYGGPVPLGGGCPQ